MEIELASAGEIAALKALWVEQERNREPSTCKKWDKKWKYTEEHKQELTRISTEYRESEETRKALWPRRRKRDAEDEKFERIFKEKHEDPNYYGVRAEIRRKA